MDTRRFDGTNKLNTRKTGGITTMKGRILVNLVLLVALLALSGMQPMNASVVTRELEVNNLEVGKARVLETYGQLPLAFIPNQGQVDERVSYYVQAGGQSLWFTADGVTMALPEATLYLEFVNSNPSAQAEGDNKLPGIVNYFIGNDPTEWRTNIPTYGSVVYHNLWPGVDLNYEGQPGVLKSTFTISPGADPHQIRLDYLNVDSLAVDEEGNLVISVNGRKTTESTPLAWQEVAGQRVAVAVTYQVVGKSYGFTLPDDYNPTYSLVIDPQLVYSTFLGGSSDDYGYGIVVDGIGNAYVAGCTDSSDFPTTAGAFDVSHNGNGDVFVVKLSETGSNLLYATFLGGSNYEVGRAIAIDAVGNTYVTGRTISTNFPTTTGAFDTTHNNGADVYIVKLNPAGNDLLYATFVGGKDDESGEAITINGSGAAYITGYVWSSNFPTSVGAFDTSHNGGWDAFVAKLNANGSDLAYATFLGGNDNDYGDGISVDKSGMAYATGHTWSANFPTTFGSFDTTHNGNSDTFVVKLNTSGSDLLYAAFLGGNENDEFSSIAVDGDGVAYVVGMTESSDFPTTTGAFDTTHNGGSDVIVVKLNPAGNDLLYATFVGGSGGDDGYAIAVDGSEAVWVTGRTTSLDFPVTPDAFDTNPSNRFDVFVAKLNGSGNNLLYATFLGGNNYDWGGQAITLDRNGVAYITGLTYSTDFPTTNGVFDTTHNGFRDVFVAKLDLGPGITPPFLDLPVSYSNFSQSALGKVGAKGPGRVNSWFDHTYPTYKSPPNAGTNNITKWDGKPIPIDSNMSAEEFKKGIGLWWYDGHNGVDFQHQWAIVDESVFAAAPGTVINTIITCQNGDSACGSGYGNQVLVDHHNGYATLYGHLKTVSVVSGQEITNPASQPVGIMGNTGNSTGTHLHFEVQLNGTTVDPYGWDEVGAGVPDPWTPASTYLWKYRLQEQKMVDNTGASLTSPAGNKQATISPGALSSLVTVELWDAPVASPSASLRSVGHSFWLRVLEWLSGGGGLSASSGVTAMGFSQPITLTVTYGMTETRHLNSSQMSIYRWDGSDWVVLPSTLEPGKVTAETMQVGEFDIQAPLLCPADQPEPDDHYDAASTILTTGTPTSRLFDIPDDEDWLKFTAVVSKTYEISTSNLATNVDTIIELYAPDGVTLLVSDDNSGGGAASTLEWVAPLDGTYFIRVVPAGGSASGCDATYALSIAEKTQPSGGIYLPIILKNHP